MIRCLTVGDQHFDIRTPRARKDDYFATMDAKLSEIQALEKEHNVDITLLTGDLLHRQGAQVPWSLGNWLIDRLRDGRRRAAAMGNHDIHGNADNWHKQPIGTLVRAGVIEPLWQDRTPANPLGEKTIDVGHVRISGKLFDFDADLPERRAMHYKVDRAPSMFHIMVAHTALIPDGFRYPSGSTTPEELTSVLPQAVAPDLYVVGHIHDFLGEYGHDHIRAVNFGSLSRGSIDESNLRRHVHVGLLEIDGMTCTATPIQLKSSQAPQDIFDVAERDEEKRRHDDLDKLADALRAGTLTDEFRIVNPSEAMQAVFDLQAVRPEVAALVRQYVAEAEKEL